MGNVVSAHISTVVFKPRESDSDVSFVYRQRRVSMNDNAAARLQSFTADIHVRAMANR